MTFSTQGITVSFYANILGSNAADGRFFELNNIGAKGTNIWANNSPTRYISMWASGAKMETAYYRQDSDYGVDGSVITAKPSSSPTADAWHQYVVTIGGTTTTVYIDGAEITYSAKTTVNYQDISDTAEKELSKVTLTPVDTEGYQNFDAAYTVASSVDEDMYAAEKFAEFMTIVNNAYSNVYTTTTAENADLYNSVTSGVDITENTQLRTSLTTANTDINTAAILTAIDSLKDYIRTLRVNISENVENPVVTSKYFCSGEAFSVALPDNVNVSDGKAVHWVITEYATNEDMENGAEPLSSRVVTKYPDECVELVARGAVDIQHIVDGGVRTSKYIYRVYIPYGNAVEIIYSDDLVSASDLDGKINYNPVLPFYKFVSWSVTDLGNDEFKVVPEFTI